MKYIAIALLLFIPELALADFEMENQGVLTGLANIFKQAINSLGAELEEYASWLLLTCLAISFILRVGIKAVANGFIELSDVLVEVVSSMIYGGIVFWILDNSFQMVMDVISSFAAVAMDSAEVVQNFSPSDIVDVGWKIYDRISETSSVFNVVESIESWILSIIILVIYTLIAVDVLFLIIASYILSYCSCLYFALWGLEATRGITYSFISTVIAFGFRLFGLMFVVGIGLSVVNNMINFVDGTDDIMLTQGYLTRVLVAVFIVYGLSKKVPDMLGSIVGHQGQSGFSGGSGVKAMSSSMQSAVGAISKSAAAISIAAAAIGGLASKYGNSSAATQAQESASGGGSFSAGNDGLSESSAAAMSVEPTITRNEDGSLSYSPVKPSEVKQTPDIAKAGLNQAREALRGGNAKT